LVARFSVLVDGRVKPGQDGKPKIGRERVPSTANAISREISRKILAENQKMD
jgi:hypothetical protein